MLLHQIAFIKTKLEVILALRMERYEIGLVYKYYMMKGVKHEVKIHGDESAALASAAKAMLYEEAARVEGKDLSFTWAIMETDLVQKSYRCWS